MSLSRYDIFLVARGFSGDEVLTTLARNLPPEDLGRHEELCIRAYCDYNRNWIGPIEREYAAFMRGVAVGIVLGEGDP